MKPKELIAIINKHLKKTGETPSSFGRRVLGDQSFLWKLKNYGREPRDETVKKIVKAIKYKEKEDELIRAAKAAIKVGLIEG